MRLKKILQISPTDIRYDSRILKELKSLEQLKNTKLLAYGINDDEGHKYGVKPISYVRIFNLWTKKLTLLPRPLLYALNLVEAILRLTIPAIKYRPDIIHCHDTLFLPIALVVKFFCKSKIIYDAHELESDKAGQSKILEKYTLFIEKISWKYIDFLISVSPSIIEWYNTNLGIKESELILNSPVLSDVSNESTKSNYLRNKFKISSNEKIYLYLGIISKKGRGIELYLEAFKNLKLDSHLVFIGYGDFVDEVRETASKFGNIHYHPAVPHDQVVEISKSADIGLCMIEPISLSDYYCLPNKLFEYAFSGLYVLSSNLPDIKKIVEDYSLGKCSSNDLGELQEIINSINDMNLSPKTVDIDKMYPLTWAFQEEKLLELYKIKLLN